ncbi:MAG: ABC transporter ATP-binding protein [Opitutales bacterium]
MPSSASKPPTDRGRPDDSSLPAGSRPLLRRLFGLFWEHHTASLGILALQLSLLAMTLGGLSFLGLGIDTLRARVGEAPAPDWPLGLTGPQGWDPLNEILLIAGLVALFAILRGVLTYGAQASLAWLVHRRIVPNLQRRVFRKLQQLDFRFFDSRASGAIINRVTGDVQSVRSFVDVVMIEGLRMIITLAVYTAYMLAISPTLTLVCLLPVPIMAVLSAAFSKIVRPEFLKNRSLFDRLILFFSETISGAQTLKGFVREPEMVAAFRDRNDDVQNQQHRIFWRISIFTPIINGLSQLTLVLLLVFGGWMVIQGQITLGGGLVVFATLLQQFGNQVTSLAQVVNSVQESLAGSQRVFEILDEPVRVQSPPDPVRADRLSGSVVFEDVTFRHIEDRTTLENVSFHHEAGQCLAVVGETGAGKSALLSLIPRFYDPAGGRVLIDGVDARAYALDDLRHNIGIVFQENVLFSDTVAANIRFGHPAATMEDVVRAAKRAQADGFISELSDGYDTFLDEGGKNLSGGQRQRIAIARALLTDPSILLLDDPTSAIDPETEDQILQAIDNAIAGRTTFVVAHRLSTLKRADRILVMKQGRIVEAGTHTELLEQGGLYREAAAIQMVDPESKRLLEQMGTHVPKEVTT